MGAARVFVVSGEQWAPPERGITETRCGNASMGSYRPLWSWSELMERVRSKRCRQPFTKPTVSDVLADLPHSATGCDTVAMMSRLSIVVPVLNEAEVIEDLLHSVSPLRRQGAEVIVVDGGSSDDTRARAHPLADQVLTAPRGRASQMNAGAAHASRDILVFLHADTRLREDAALSMLDQMARRRAAWGRFDVRVEGRHFLLPVIAALMNARSRLTGIATGDQAIFVRRDAFLALGGYSDIPLMEDIELSRRLKQGARPLCVAERVSTSGRRWEKHGFVRTILLMWRLRTAYFLGADPRRLAKRYGYSPRDD